MQDSDIAGIERNGALARERGVSFFDNPHHFADKDWLALSSYCAAGWRGEDQRRNEATATLDRIRYW